MSGVVPSLQECQPIGIVASLGSSSNDGFSSLICAKDSTEIEKKMAVNVYRKDIYDNFVVLDVQTNSKNDVNEGAGLSGVFLMIFTMSTLLFMLGIYIILALHSENIVRYLKERTTIVLELKEASKLEADNIVKTLSGDERVISSSAIFVGKDQALTFMREQLGENLMIDSLGNPFNDIIEVNLKAQYTGDKELSQWSQAWKDHPAVSWVYYQNDYIDLWGEWKKRLWKWTGVSALILLMVTILLIFNTVNLSIVQRKSSIEIMELVGAEWAYIRRPFLRVSIKIGLVAALFASVLLALLCIAFALKTPHLINYFNWYFMLITLVVLLAIGVSIQYLSTKAVVNRALKQAVAHLRL